MFLRVRFSKEQQMIDELNLVQPYTTTLYTMHLKIDKQLEKLVAHVKLVKNEAPFLFPNWVHCKGHELASLLLVCREYAFYTDP